jgi:hypothetical protein
MRMNRLFEIQELIPPGMGPHPDDLESVEDHRQEEISKVERALAQSYFRACVQAGFDMTTEEDYGIPVHVTFYPEDATVEINITPSDDYTVQSLLKLIQAGVINDTAKIGYGGGRDILQTLQAANSPFRQFMNLDGPGIGSGGVASSS